VDLLALTEIESSSEYELEGETSTGSALPLYMSSLLTPLPLILLSSLSSSLPSYNMS